MRESVKYWKFSGRSLTHYNTDVVGERHSLCFFADNTMFFPAGAQRPDLVTCDKCLLRSLVNNDNHLQTKHQALIMGGNVACWLLSLLSYNQFFSRITEG